MPSLIADGPMLQVHIPLAFRTRTFTELAIFMVWHQRY